MLWSGKRSPCLETSHHWQPANQIIWIVNCLFHFQNLIGDVNIWRPDPVTEPRLTFQTDKTNVFTPLKSLQECNFDFVPVQTC